MASGACGSRSGCRCRAGAERASGRAGVPEPSGRKYRGPSKQGCRGPRQAAAAAYRRVEPSAMLKRAGWTAAVLLTVAVGGLHLLRLLHAGGLWRDEAAAVALATLPTVREIAPSFQH